ncbi:WD40 repeat-like protein [Aulographum hederae CBS 113979]|uniref:WD40 repeat-like protein n=1 Tax=Aulographum hederae CBS 113979 TaxID=1176131 RepID=A0A6G1HEB8_9PEZI|nr:WD40 repeat-like protein [Aulographum hederae CBS 113979]
MSLTPSNPRMNASLALRMTPANSPLTRLTSRSPTKTSRSDGVLSLKQVIGSTNSSANAFDTLQSARSVAFTAGAAAVVASFDDDLRITQRFYRARPTAVPQNPTPSIYGPSTPTTAGADARSRTAASLQNAGIGNSPFTAGGGEWTDSPGGKTWSARERVKAATCVSFSPDGKFLAVGETGYKPRVLVFSAATDASRDTPLTCLSDHYFGVRCVAFSPDSQYLASLGASNDGYLYIWSINTKTGSATLFASNRCSNNVTRIAWMGRSLVTIGTRHVKMWRVDPASDASASRTGPSDPPGYISPSNKILQGRNCLLGPLLDTTFTTVTIIDPSKAVICSEKGDICLLDDSTGKQSLDKIANSAFSIKAGTLSGENQFLATGKDGAMCLYNVTEWSSSAQMDAIRSIPAFIQSNPESDSRPCHFVALAPFLDHLISVDSQGGIKLRNVQFEESNDLLGPTIQELPAHGGSVLGVQPVAVPNSIDASFLTWTADGSIFFWSDTGAFRTSKRVELEQLEGYDNSTANELKVVRLLSGKSGLVTGDKYGVFRILDQTSGDVTFTCKAHSGEITDIAIYEGPRTFIACSGRDRTVQVFQEKNDSWELLQTLDEHVGAVIKLLFSSNGKRLLSCSSDRTVVLREAVSREDDGDVDTAYLIVRTITLKASPMSMILDPDQENILIVSTMDRGVHRYALRTGHSLSSFKASDSEGGDAVVLSAMVLVPSSLGSPLLAGVSSTDKSIRLYDDSGSLVGRDWGHTEGVTAICLIESKPDEGEGSQAQKSLVTVAVDGTIFVWNTTRSPRRQDLSQSMELMGVSTPRKDLIANKPPLRRVLSQSEIARFQKSGDDISPVSTPTGNRSPKVRKRVSSKFSLAQAPRLDPSPMPRPALLPSSLSASEVSNRRASVRRRSPSPSSPPRNIQRSMNKRPSMNFQSRTKSLNHNNTNNDTNSHTSTTNTTTLTPSTEAVCRALRTYRKKLASTPDIPLDTATIRELDRELKLTARAVGEKAIKSKQPGVDEQVLVKLLDQYSERLVEMLDLKLMNVFAKQSTGGATAAAAAGAGAASETVGAGVGVAAGGAVVEMEVGVGAEPGVAEAGERERVVEGEKRDWNLAASGNDGKSDCGLRGGFEGSAQAINRKENEPPARL